MSRMKRYLRPFAFAALLIFAVLLGLMLGKGGGIAGLWADVQSLFGREKYQLDPNDPVLKAGLPQPDPLAGLPDSPLNDFLTCAACPMAPGMKSATSSPAKIKRKSLSFPRNIPP